MNTSVSVRASEMWDASFAIAESTIRDVVDVTPCVFVVDDDIAVRESLKLLIKNAGWRPETFTSAEEFLSRPHGSMPCCLVLDLTLPGLSGLELQKRLAERMDMPVIF